jgi:hypothetical protein
MSFLSVFVFEKVVGLANNVEFRCSQGGELEIFVEGG